MSPRAVTRRTPRPPSSITRPADRAGSLEGRRRVIVERVRPEIDGGRFPIKRTVGESVRINAWVHADGHDVIVALLRYRAVPAGVTRGEWLDHPMQPLGNDEWAASFDIDRQCDHEYTVQAWIDRFESWRKSLVAKVEASQDVSSDLLEGAALVRETAGRARAARAAKDARWLDAQADLIGGPAAMPERARVGAGRSAPRPFPPVPGSEPGRDLRASADGAGRSRTRPFRRLVRNVPAIVGTGPDPQRDVPRSRDAPAARRREWASTSSTFRRSIRSARASGRAAAIRSTAGSQAIPAVRGRSAPKPAGTKRWSPARHARRLRPFRRRSQAARPRGRARHRLSVFAGSPLRSRASGVVSPSSRRNDQVRREPAQEVPGHLSVRLRDAKRGRRCGEELKSIVQFWIGTGRSDLPRRQPAYQAVPVLGMADPARSGPSIRTPSSSPKRLRVRR